MTSIQNICVYCGSSSQVDEAYKQAAIDFGQAISSSGRGLVYGGGRVGLMGLIADSVMDSQGTAIGIIPEHIQSREIEHTDLTELHIVDSMHVRKQMMVDRSDAFVVLPGGIGTLDETCEIITWRQLGIHDKPIVICNLGGYWTPFVKMIEHIIGAGFMRKEDRNIFQVVERIEDIIPALENAPEESFDPSSKWI